MLADEYCLRFKVWQLFFTDSLAHTHWALLPLIYLGWHTLFFFFNLFFLLLYYFWRKKNWIIRRQVWDTDVWSLWKKKPKSHNQIIVSLQHILNEKLNGRNKKFESEKGKNDQTIYIYMYICTFPFKSSTNGEPNFFYIPHPFISILVC